MVIKATPQILKRISVRWLPDEAYENTDTIALNVGGFYMDLRIVTADQSLEWSRAGERKAVISEDPTTFQWTRLIDSLGSTQTDEAAFTNLPNGDDLESGIFTKDGTPTAYEEVWRDVTGAMAENMPSWIVQSKNGYAFYGKVRGICIGMRRDEQGHFEVRREDYDPSEKCWKLVFESGTGAGQGLQRAEDIVQLVEGSELGKLADYVILGYAR
jgi:hypothetical protein